MLNDEHFVIPYYEPDSNKVFPGLSTPIKGGIAISYRDDKSNYGAIKAFTQFTELNAIMHKVIDRKNFESLSNIVYTRTAYRLTPKMHEDIHGRLKDLVKDMLTICHLISSTYYQRFF